MLAAFSPLALAQSADEAEPSVSVLVMDRIAVSGDRPMGSPGMIEVLSGVSLERLPTDHPAEALNVMSGVNVQMNSVQEHLISIRSPVLTSGAGQGSFLLLENGLPMRAAAFGNVNGLIDTHSEISEGVEVIKGPGSARYGSNAVHGLINYLQPNPGAASSFLDVSASTLGRYKATGLGAFGGDALKGYVGLTFADDSGWRDDSGGEQKKATVGLAGDLGEWSALASFVYVGLNQETAGYINDFRDADFNESNPNPEAYRDAWTARTNLRLSRQMGPGELALTPFVISQRMEFIQHFLPYDGLEENGHDSVGLQARYRVNANDRFNWTIGADIQWASGFLSETQEVASFGPFPQGPHYDYDVDTLVFAGFAEAGWQLLDKVRLTAGIRGEAHAYDYQTNLAPGTNGRFLVADDRSDDFELLTPKLGVVYDVAEAQQVYVNLARGQRAPQASDLYRLQSTQVVGEIKAETLDSVELGWRGVFDMAGAQNHWNLAVYAMEKENFFFRDSNRLNVPNGKTEHVGAELSISGDLGADTGLFWRTGLAYAEHRYAFDRNVSNAAEIITDGNLIDTAPRWLADLQVGYQGDQWNLAVDAEYVDAYFTNAANSRVYPGHTVMHARLGFNVLEKHEIYLAARNLFDTRYADRADFGFGSDRYFPGEPFNVTVGMRLRR